MSLILQIHVNSDYFCSFHKLKAFIVHSIRYTDRMFFFLCSCVVTGKLLMTVWNHVTSIDWYSSDALSFMRGLTFRFISTVIQHKLNREVALDFQETNLA